MSLIVMAVPYAEFNESLLLAQTIAELVLTIEFFIILIILIKRYRVRKKEELGYLIKVFLSMMIGIGLSTIPMILCMADVDIYLNYGIPLFVNGAALWWSNFTYLMMTIASIQILKFTMTLFKKPSDRVFKIYVVLVIAFNIWSIYFGIFEYEPGDRSLTIPMAALFILLEFYAWFQLFSASRRDAKRVEKSIYQLGLSLIYISAGLMLVGFILWTFSMITGLHQQMGAIIWTINCFTGFLLYIGYTLPPWFRKLFEKRYQND